VSLALGRPARLIIDLFVSAVSASLALGLFWVNIWHRRCKNVLEGLTQMESSFFYSLLIGPYCMLGSGWLNLHVMYNFDYNSVREFL
jgi:hypothetical protein